MKHHISRKKKLKALTHPLGIYKKGPYSRSNADYKAKRKAYYLANRERILAEVKARRLRSKELANS